MISIFKMIKGTKKFNSTTYRKIISRLPSGRDSIPRSGILNSRLKEKSVAKSLLPSLNHEAIFILLGHSARNIPNCQFTENDVAFLLR